MTVFPSCTIDLRGHSQDHDPLLRIGNAFGNESDHFHDRCFPWEVQFEKRFIPCMIPIANIKLVALSDVPIDEQEAS